MMNRLFPLLALLLVPLIPLCGADDFTLQREQFLALGSLTAVPAAQPAEGRAEVDGMKAIYFDALPWKGRPTKVFAWLGVPKNHTNKVPGVVLVHGGGGTAFDDWVKKWNDHGYAAISIAVEGQTDLHDHQDSMTWSRHAWAGPARDGIYGDSSEPLENQWIYHAVADTILANTLLRSLPEVDAARIGTMGISWGGVICSTAIGLDSRFAFAIPTYGCGHLADSQNQYGRALGTNELYKKVLDPVLYLNKVNLPVLWFSWPEDLHFPLDDQAACYRASPGPHMVSLIPSMGHGHQKAWSKPDSYAFAESIVRDGKPWCIEKLAKTDDGTAQAVFTSAKALDHAVLISTTDHGITGRRQWNSSPATLERHDTEWRAIAPLPKDTTAWFINVQSGELTASSNYQTVN